MNTLRTHKSAKVSTDNEEELYSFKDTTDIEVDQKPSLAHG